MRHPAWFAIPLTAILIALAALHAYWALGGRWGIDNTIPMVNGRRAINPGPLATWIVCGLLATAAFLAPIIIRVVNDNANAGLHRGIR